LSESEKSIRGRGGVEGVETSGRGRLKIVTTVDKLNTEYCFIYKHKIARFFSATGTQMLRLFWHYSCLFYLDFFFLLPIGLRLRFS